MAARRAAAGAARAGRRRPCSGRRCTARRQAASAATPPGGEVFDRLFPDLAGLPADSLRSTLGHLFLAVEQGWPEVRHVWSFDSDSLASGRRFSAFGLDWGLDAEMALMPAVDRAGGGVYPATFRRVVLSRLTPGHPLPVAVDVVYRDTRGGERRSAEEFYSPLQPYGAADTKEITEAEAAAEAESFEILRMSDVDDDVRSGAIDMRNPKELELTMRLCPAAVPRLLRGLREAAASRQAEATAPPPGISFKLRRDDAAQPMGFLWAPDAPVLLMAFAGTAAGASGERCVGHRLRSVDGAPAGSPAEVAQLTAGKRTAAFEFSALPAWESARSTASLSEAQRGTLRDAARGGRVTLEGFAAAVAAAGLQLAELRTEDVCRAVAAAAAAAS
eukprot:TRINITY_DN61913_c0_g1_i1.p1 TRINITY_DN61913_c0_g1~~TRINITY_DN61913_c0_g1_i1.p1  ORF type:complete len:408 (+),score=109.44 TRINITY_DN61913_c0_g1_i1:59-1225(+)